MKTTSKEKVIVADYSFQEEAVLNIEKDIEKNRKAKILLVIPTGGGKTKTALKAIHKLKLSGIISPNQRVLWVTHLKNLRTQVQDELTVDPKKKYTEEELAVIETARSILDVELVAGAKNALELMGPKYQLIIIDEAHHTGADSYQVFLEKDLPVLGLTATPVRNDERMLGYDKISYQITYRELLSRHVVLKPEFLTVETNTEVGIDNTSDFTDSGLINRAYNSSERNEAIAEAIFRAKNAHKRVVIFAGSNNHVDSLYDIIRRKNKLEGEQYHVGYIYSEARNGKTNERGVSNDEYLRWHKRETTPTILVNCGILTEGYDDPSIDTVVLTVPTKSVLYYMQCVGRVVRRPPPNPAQTEEQKTYVLECKDKYVNFVYRIGNEWLFADLSATLEPVVINQEVKNESETRIWIYKLMKEHHVEEKYFNFVPENPDPETTSILFLKSTKSEEYKIWYPLIVTPTNRNIYTRIFNELSANISKYADFNPSYLIFDKLQLEEGDQFFASRNSAFVNNFVQALVLAYTEKLNKKEIKRIRYYNFFVRKRERWWPLQILVVAFRKIRHFFESIKS